MDATLINLGIIAQVVPATQAAGVGSGMAAGGQFSALDITIVLGGVALMVLVGFIAGRGERDTRDFFLGGRGVPWWAVCLSFVATEVSAATIVAVPADSFRNNWHYLQMFIGSALARVTVAMLFIPVFFKLDCTTIYEYLGHRFGPATRYMATLFFFITRLLGSAVRLFVAAMGTAVILGWTADVGRFEWGIVAAIAVYSLVGIAFISYGGIKAVIWTNVLQAVVILGGGLAAVIYLVGAIDGGWSTVAEVTRRAEKFRIFDYSQFVGDSSVFWLLVANGYLISLTVYGTDQEMMQRLLTVKTRGASQKSMILSTLVALPTVTMFLLVGTLLYVYQQQHAEWAVPTDNDRILPMFVAQMMPSGIRGLLLATIVMASIDSPLASLASSFVTDVYRPLVKREHDAAHYLRVSRWSVVVFGVLLGVLAYGAVFLTARLWVAFQILGAFGGGLLGVFLLGLLTIVRGDRSNVAAMGISALVTGVLWILIHRGTVKMEWTWLILIGLGITVVLGMAFGRTAPRDHEDSPRIA